MVLRPHREKVPGRAPLERADDSRDVLEVVAQTQIVAREPEGII